MTTDIYTYIHTHVYYVLGRVLGTEHAVIEKTKKQRLCPHLYFGRSKQRQGNK